jgi:hypothetical protein
MKMSNDGVRSGGTFFGAIARFSDCDVAHPRVDLLTKTMTFRALFSCDKT